MMPLGYWGMGIVAFIAGSFFPFSSETLLTGLLLAGLRPWPLFFSATVGNVLGSMFNYWVGSLGKIEWIENYLHVKREKVEKTQRWLKGKGAWMGFFCFLPVLGSALAVTLGYMRANLSLSFLSIALGKAIRYGILIMLLNMVKG
jgi:membrane protein YqaA with SNARE-associated domain